MARTVLRWRETAVAVLVASVLALGGCAGSTGGRTMMEMDDGMKKGDTMMKREGAPMMEKKP